MFEISFNSPFIEVVSTMPANLRLVPPAPALPAIIEKADIVPGGVFGSLPATDDEETLEEATRRIRVKYDAMVRYGSRTIGGVYPSLIVSGPPGMSKSFTIDSQLARSRRQRHDGVTPLEEGAHDWYDKISGGCTAPGVYQSLWNMREGGLYVVDDCDSVFEDIETLNLLKIATDTSDKRILSWRKRSSWLADFGIAKNFEFKGHVIFLTNKDFEKIIEKGTGKDIEHYRALVDRANYLCLTLRTQRDFMIQIRYVVEELGMLRKMGLTTEQEKTVMEYIEENKMRFYNLSLRLVGKVAQAMLADPDQWRDDIEATNMRSHR